MAGNAHHAGCNAPARDGATATTRNTTHIHRQGIAQPRPLLGHWRAIEGGNRMDSSTWLGIALLVAGALVLLSELHTLTIYLLAIAAGLFAAGGLALAGGSLTATLILLAVVVILGMPVAHWARKKLKNHEAEAVTHDDVGRSVTIAHVDANAWRVNYRGTTWSARPEAAVAITPAAGEIWRIARREGNTLILAPSDSTNTTGGVS